MSEQQIHIINQTFTAWTYTICIVNNKPEIIQSNATSLTV